MKAFNFVILPFFLIIFLISCKKNIWTDEENQNRPTKLSYNIPLLKDIYDKEKNPYSVSNMLIAYGICINNNDVDYIKKVSKIATTHFYVKFIPESFEKEGVLKADSTIILYKYPIDNENWETVKNLTYLKSGSKPQIYYSAVPVNYKFPDVKFQILDELFIPDDYTDNRSKSLMTNNILSSTDRLHEVDIQKLVNKSFEITGNGILASNTTARSGSWRPSGRIRVLDNTASVNSLVGIEGLEIKARRWFTTHRGYTDTNGFFICDGTFKNPCNYSFDWERYDFEIMGDGASDGISGITYDGPKITGDWYLDITSGKHLNYASTFRPAYHYYYKDRKGLRQPPNNSFWKTKLKLKVFQGSDPDGSVGNHNPARRFLNLGSAIHIYAGGRSFEQIYGTSIHEIAHASHWNMSSGGDYTNCNDNVAESWARGVQWELTRMVYTDYVPDVIRPNYTLIVRDMIDGIKNYEQVEGYTIRQIEDALLGKRTWISWRDNIKSMYNNPTEIYLDNLFLYWQ